MATRLNSNFHKRICKISTLLLLLHLGPSLDAHASPWGFIRMVSAKAARHLPSQASDIAAHENRLLDLWPPHHRALYDQLQLNEHAEVRSILVKLPPTLLEEALNAVSNSKSYKKEAELHTLIKRELLANRAWHPNVAEKLTNTEFDYALKLTEANPALASALSRLPPELGLVEARILISDFAKQASTVTTNQPNHLLSNVVINRLIEMGKALPNPERWPDTVAATIRRRLYFPVKAQDPYRGVSELVKLPASRTKIDLSAPKSEGSSAPRSLKIAVLSGNDVSIHALKVPRWEFLGIERRWVGSDLRAEVAKSGNSGPVLIFGDTKGFTTSELFPDRVSAKTFDNSRRFLKLHIDNFYNLTGRSLTKDRLKVFNEMPTEASVIADLKLQGAPSKWHKIHERYNLTSKESGVEFKSGSQKSSLIHELEKATSDLIAIIAHGDSRSISLADGSKITVADIAALPDYKGQKKPIIILFSCQTGATPAGFTSVAQALLMKGRAAAVLAPTTKIPAAGDSLLFFRRLLTSAERHESVLEAFSAIPPNWQLLVSLTPFRPTQPLLQERDSPQAIRSGAHGPTTSVAKANISPTPDLPLSTAGTNLLLNSRERKHQEVVTGRFDFRSRSSSAHQGR